MSRRKLTETEIADALKNLKGWALADGKLHCEYTCKDFVNAWGKMCSAALVAEAMNHHPAWSNVWNRVTVDLWTHDAGGITENDVKLAAKFSEIFGA